MSTHVPTRVEKPWGYELHWAKTDRYVGKILHINAGHALSLQYHNVKDETVMVHSGKLLYEIEIDGVLTKTGDEARRRRSTSRPKTVHRMTAIEDTRRARGVDAGTRRRGAARGSIRPDDVEP